MATKKQPREKFAPFDPADYLKSTEDMVAYLEASMEESGDDPTLGTVLKVVKALGIRLTPTVA